MMRDSTPGGIFRGSVAKRLLKPILFAIVIVGVVQAIRVAGRDLARTQEKAEQRIAELETQIANVSGEERFQRETEIAAIRRSLFSLKNVRWYYFLGAIPMACLSVLPAGWLWWRTLSRSGHNLPRIPTLAAYTIGGLGKYVPGKAMVLILRSSAMQKRGVPITTSIVSIFIETLFALVAAGSLGTLALSALSIPAWLRWILVATSIAAFIPMAPPFFRRIVLFVSQSRHVRVSPHLANAIDWQFVGTSWLLCVLGQILGGLGLWLICLAVHDASSSAAIGVIPSIHLIIVSVAATSMGFVVGFLSMLPGGAGARELVVTVVLAPVLGYAPALGAAVLFRIASLVGDLLAAGILWMLDRNSRA